MHEMISMDVPCFAEVSAVVQWRKSDLAGRMAGRVLL